MKSIMQDERECFRCCTTYGLEEHHVMYGTANRRLSEKYGLKVWLCHECHRGNNGVHHNKHFDRTLKKMAQTDFEDVYKDITFREVFGKNII